MKRRITFKRNNYNGEGTITVSAYDTQSNCLGDYLFTDIQLILSKSQVLRFNKLLSGEIDNVNLNLERFSRYM